MTYAYITDATINAEAGNVPTAARRLDDGRWVLALRDASVELQEACGWFAVTDTPRPPDTPTTTHDRTVELVNNVPTVVWTERPKTQAELDAEQAAAESTVRRTDLQAAVSTLRQWSDDAEATTVTNGNNQAVTQTMVTRLGVFFDRFADLLTETYGQ